MTLIMIDPKYDYHHEYVKPKKEVAMKVSREQMAENRSRILAEAARLFRDKGFDAVSVVEVMKALKPDPWRFLRAFRVEG